MTKPVSHWRVSGRVAIYTLSARRNFRTRHNSVPDETPRVIPVPEQFSETITVSTEEFMNYTEEDLGDLEKTLLGKTENMPWYGELP